jgi:hypothetical protein
MAQEVIFSDGSVAIFNGGGGSSHDGGLAIERLRLIYAKSALKTYIRTNGKMEVTRGGANKAIVNVISPLTGIKYPRSIRGKEAALADCEALIAAIEGSAVVLEVE